MAGYIFSISKDSWSDFCKNNLSKGYFTPYTVEISKDHMTDSKRKARNKILVATFGDIVTMKPGDNIYFLSDRKLYGVGSAVQIGPDCKYDNYENASAILPDCQMTPTEFLTTQSTRARWVCLFKPNPYYFKTGVDMDDVLRYRPDSFKMLRAFEGLTFIKIDDEENRALKEYIFLANEKHHDDIDAHVFEFDESVHKTLSLMDLTNYQMDICKVLDFPDNKNYVISEMYVESALLQGITSDTINDLGHWDYVSHQIIASPFKPLKYIDKIDIFGYRFSQYYIDDPKLIIKYLIIELKKDTINQSALEQTMQYVDWICKEYASGDYSKIEAYVVGDKAVKNIKLLLENICQRSFIASSHPAKPVKWNNLHLITYNIADSINFEEME